MKHLVTGSILTILATSAAQAGEFRAEVHGGYDAPDLGGRTSTVPGVTYGIGAGYDFALAPTLFGGIEANIDDSTADECVGAATTTEPRDCVKLGRDLSVGVRAGTSLGVGKLYGLAGYTNQRVRVSETVGTTTISDAKNLDGWRIGAGYQFPLMVKGYGKVEYRYSNYENGVDRHQALVGVGISL